MATNVDVAIIGTGPGGGMAACRLAETGLRVVVLEKEHLPRRKPCGGGIPSVATRLFDWDVSPYVESQIYAVQHFLDYAQPVERTRQASILMVDRSRFDRHLVERAVGEGHGRVTLREGFLVAGVEEREGGVTIVEQGGEAMHASFLIAADGAFSPTAKSLGMKRGAKPAVAIDAEVEVEPDVYEAEKDRATFNFFCLPNGYGWIFPKNGVLSCGVGSWGGKPRLQVEMTSFLERTFPKGSIRSVERFGHPIPVYSKRQQMATRRVCLVGDAAGLVDPVMGEGIRFALISGVLAAGVVAGLLEAPLSKPLNPEVPRWGEADCRIYERYVYRHVGADLEALARYIVPLYLNNPGYFYRKFFLERNSYLYLARKLAQQFQVLSPDFVAELNEDDAVTFA